METIISFILAFISMFGIYPMTGYIVETDRAENLIVVEDANGFLWEINQEVEDYTVGDGVSMLVYDNGTPEIFDDVILTNRYSGFWRE